MANALWDNLAFGTIVVFIIFFILFMKKSYDIKKSTPDVRLSCTSQTSIFSSPANERCVIFPLIDGLRIGVLSKPKTQQYLLKYNKIIKFQFEKVNNSEPQQTTIENLPDYVYIEYQDDDGCLHQFRFILTEQDKKLNQFVNKYKNFIDIVHSRMPKKVD